MTTNDQDRRVTLELTLDNLCWLRGFLAEEIVAAENDHEKVFSLHTTLAIRVAKKTLEHEHETMTKIHAAIDKTINIIDTNESLKRQIAAMTPPVA
jgi:hypothetical protein